MLVLLRKVGQKIMISDDIVIEVLSIDHGKVRLGITAPPAVPVNREEIWEANHGNPIPHLQEIKKALAISKKRR